MSRILIAILIIIVLLILTRDSSRLFLQTRSALQSPLSPSPVPATNPVTTQKPLPPSPDPTDRQTYSSAPANNLEEFNYPNSTQTSLSEDSVTLKSRDDSGVITNWYKNKIKNLGMNTTSFINTSTNGNILNKLVGSDGKREIVVEITKKNNNEEVEIELNAID